MRFNLKFDFWSILVHVLSTSKISGPIVFLYSLRCIMGAHILSCLLSFLLYIFLHLGCCISFELELLQVVPYVVCLLSLSLQLLQVDYCDLFQFFFCLNFQLSFLSLELLSLQFLYFFFT